MDLKSWNLRILNLNLLYIIFRFFIHFSLIYIFFCWPVDMWQLKWQLPPGLTSASLENIFLDMADLHPNVRCLALITATKIGVQCKCSSSQPNDSMKAITRKNKNDLPDLLDTITSAVQCMLGDPHENVKMAAALAMFCLEQKNDKVRL